MVKLIKSGFRKDRTILTVFLLIILIATFILHTGLFASAYPRLFDEYAEDGEIADYLLDTGADTETLERTFAEYDGIASYTVHDMVYIPTLSVTTDKCSEKKSDSTWMVQRYGDNVGYRNFDYIAKDDSISGKRIYLNAYTAANYSLDIGDTICLDTMYGKYEYTVAGIYQHLLMGNSYYLISVMVDEDSFAELYEKVPETAEENKIAYIYAKDGTDIDETMKKVNEQIFEESGAYVDGYSIALARDGYTIIVNILAGFMAAFAFILIVICVIMVIFTLNNNISRDIVNIGALRAVGYTVGQIRGALTAEYVNLGAVGSAVGISLSYVIFPVIEKMFIRNISGIVWKQSFYPVMSFGVLLGLLLVIIMTAYFSTRKIKMLHPATALRFGLRANSFKKNHLPLSETNGELNLLLALKSSMQNLGQNITIFFIITAVAFVTVFSGLLFYNTKIDITKFQRMVQGDAPDIYVTVTDDSYENFCNVIDKISKADGVSQAYGLNSVAASVDESDITLIYVSNPDFVYCGVYEGEIMREDNEIVLGSTVAEKMGVGVGDEINVSYGGNSRRYLITGLQQSVMNTRLYMTDSAAQKLGVDTKYQRYRVRVENASEERVDEVISRIEALNDDTVNKLSNNYKELRSKENTPVFAVSFMVLVMIVLSVATVLLVIRLLLKTVFIKKEREFGIKKAIGFTSNQLRYQLSLSLMPTTVIASVFGSVLGYFLLDPMFTLILGGYGIKNSDLILKPVIMAITAVSVTLIVFASSFIMSGRMKKLSAYKLMQE